MKRPLVFIVAPLIVGLPLAGLVWHTAAQAPLDTGGQEKITQIKPGTPTGSIADQLKNEGIIRSKLAFMINAKLRGDLLQAGVYRLSPSQTVGEVVRQLAEGKVAEHLITIPEGWRILEIASHLAKKDVVGKNDFLVAANGKEGYLFPDTYRFGLNDTADEIVRKMRANFDRRTDEAGLSLTRDDIILASIIEREAKNDEERSKIAAVYRNRLKISMRLEADPTVQFAKSFLDPAMIEPWPKVTASDYRSVGSLYNTYLVDGLPPGPICNPGLASLKAAVNPAQSDDLYFFHTADGQTIFSKTLDEHNAKKKQYNL